MEVEKAKNEAKKRQVLRGKSHIFLASKMSIVMRPERSEKRA